MIRFFHVPLLLAVAAVLPGCQDTQSVTKRYEVTATLRVGEEVASGSAVWEAIIADGPDIFFQYGPVNDVEGEAIQVEVASGQSIFLLRRPANPPKDFLGVASLPYGAFVRSCVRLDTADPQFMTALAEFGGTCETSATPAMVRFGDQLDPTTLEVVEYGPGQPVELVGIRVTTTSSPVTSEIVQSLPWLEGMQENTNIKTGAYDGQISAGYYFRAGQIYAIDFKKGHNE